MPEYYKVKDHPLTNKWKRRASVILWLLGLRNYSDASLFKAQGQLIKELISIEDGIRYYRAEQSKVKEKAVKQALNAKDEDGKLTDRDKAEIKALQLDEQYFGYAIDALRYGRWFFRYIADGIAWRVYDFDRQWIRALGGKQPVPCMSTRNGIDGEIKFFRAIRKSGRS